MCNPDLLSQAKDAATIIAACVASYAALAGLNAWKHQLHGKEDYELARRYLREVYRLRNGFRTVRSPFISVGEMVTALKAAGVENPDPQADRKQTDFAVYSRRWEDVKKATLALDVELLEAEVLWGKEAVAIQKPLRALSNRLFLAVQRFLDGRGDGDTEAVLYELSDDDKFNTEVAQAIKTVEAYLTPHITMVPAKKAK